MWADVSYLGPQRRPRCRAGSRVSNLSGRIDPLGSDKLLDNELERDNTIDNLAVLDTLLLTVTMRHDALAA